MTDRIVLPIYALALILAIAATTVTLAQRGPLPRVHPPLWTYQVCEAGGIANPEDSEGVRLSEVTPDGWRDLREAGWRVAVFQRSVTIQPAEDYAIVSTLDGRILRTSLCHPYSTRQDQPGAIVTTAVAASPW